MYVYRNKITGKYKRYMFIDGDIDIINSFKFDFDYSLPKGHNYECIEYNKAIKFERKLKLEKINENK